MNEGELAALLAMTQGAMGQMPAAASRTKPGVALYSTGILVPSNKHPVAAETEMSCLRDSSSRPSSRQQFQAQVRAVVDDSYLPPPGSSSTITTKTTATAGTGTRRSRDGQPRHHLPSDHRSRARSAGSVHSGRKLMDNAYLTHSVVEERAAWSEFSKKHPPPLPEKSDLRSSFGSYRYRSASPSPLRPAQQHWIAITPGLNIRKNKASTTSLAGKPDQSVELSGELPESGLDSDLCSLSPMHKSKFSEGSMSNRSAAISSTWEQHGHRLSDSSSDHNAGNPWKPDTNSTGQQHGRTPRDNRDSVDASEYPPRPTTPSAIKKTLTKLGNHFKPVTEDLAQPTNEQKPTKRKGLRKSLSNWNLHLGEKMHLFASSSNNDLGLPDPSTTATATAVSATSPANKRSLAEMERLDERKEKAEAAYAAQFGFKKQKGNDGQPTSPDSLDTAWPPARSVKRRKSMPSTMHRDDQASACCEDLHPAETMSDAETDLPPRRRLTRKELEKENEQLRAMLRERNEKPAALSISQHNPLPAATGTVKSQHKTARPGQGIPPVPPLPSREVLATLAVSNNAGNLYCQKPAFTKRSNRISTIMEDDENAVAEAEMANLEFGSILPGLNPSPLRPREQHQQQEDKWEWPDDVF